MWKPEENTRKTYFFLNAFLWKNDILVSRQRFLMVLTCSWVSWPKNDAERSRNYFKKSVLDPKHAKFDKNPSFGHVRAVGGIMGYSGSVNFKHLLRFCMVLRRGAQRTLFFYQTTLYLHKKLTWIRKTNKYEDKFHLIGPFKEPFNRTLQ